MALNRTISVLLVTRLLGRKGEKVRLMSFTGGAHNWELCLRLPPPPTHTPVPGSLPGSFLICTR